MKTIQFVIILILILLLTGIVGYSFYKMWNKQDEEVVIVYETYKEKIKLNCTDLKLSLRKLFGEHASLVREYILISLNNHSYDEKMALHECINHNFQKIAHQFKIICGDKVGIEIHKYLNQYISNLSELLNNFKVSDEEERQDFSIFLNKLNANVDNLSTYFSNILYRKQEGKEEKKDELSQLKTQRELKELLRGHNELIQSQIKYYNSGIFSNSLTAYLSDVEVLMGLSDYLTNKLCEKSKDNKKT